MKKCYIALGGISGKILNGLAEKSNADNQYFYFDSDRTEIHSFKNEKITKRCFFRPYTNGEILKIFPEFNEWMIDSELIQSCINCVSRISARLYFEAYFKEHCFYELFKSNEVAEETTINIITSTFGNTGSGILMNVIFLMHEYMKKNGIESYNINILFFLPEFMGKLITGKTHKNILKVNSFATIKELYNFSEICKGREIKDKVLLSKLFDSDCILDRKIPFVSNVLFYTKSNEMSDSITDNINDFVDKLYEYDISDNFSGFENANKNMFDIANPYKSAYDDEIHKLNEMERYAVTPHIDKNWHNILFEIGE